MERDLNNYRELQAYCKHISNEMRYELDPVQESSMNLEIQSLMVAKGHDYKAWKLRLNGNKQYLQDWIECVINASYIVKCSDEINWF